MKAKSGPVSEYRLLPNGKKKLVAVHATPEHATKALQVETDKIQLSGFNAIGYPIPSHRLDNAYKTVFEILPDATKELAMSIVGKCREFLEKDQPFGFIGEAEALHPDLAMIDATGRYRLMAVLLTN